jgi:uncharacterized protein YdcH (DUF465 family)
MRQRKSDHPAAMHERLARKHTDLSDRVASMEQGRLHLTATDQAELNALKREKLATKDALSAIKLDV